MAVFSEATGLKNCIRLRSGLYLDLMNPKPNQFTLNDIAGGLAKECRFCGQLDVHYSVAEHSYWCYVQCIRDGHTEQDIRKAVFMHDAAEFAFRDLPRPLKRLLPDYVKMLNRMEEVIAEKYGIDFNKHKEIWGKIDNEMLINERRVLHTSQNEVSWEGEHAVRDLRIPFKFANYAEAEKMFIDAACAMGIGE